MLSSRTPRSARENGQVVVFFALLIPVIFAIGAIVIDVGNWYVHKRHLQTQVDAAALASAPQFVGCFHDPTAANAAIASRALAYAGDTLRPGQLGPNAPPSTTNTQLAEPNDVRVALNSSRYWAPSDGMVPGPNGYGTPPLDNSIAVPGDPCSTSSLDAKATDEAVRPLWGLLPLTPSPKSHAKVEIFDLESARGMLPWAVPEIDPAMVAALFVNENNGVVFDWQYMDEADDLSLPWSEWITQPGQEPVTFGGANDRTSVVILVSKNDQTPSTTGTLGQICTQDPGLVACYAGSGQTSGLSFIHAYDGGSAGTLASPVIREVELDAAGCSAADLSSPYFTLDGGCSAFVQAVIDFDVSGDPTQHPQCARVPGYTWTSGGLGGPLGHWEGTMSLPADSGRQELDLGWTSGPRNASVCGNPNQQPNSGSFNVVAAPYIADSASGPVQYLKLQAYNDPGCNPLTVMGDANSVEKDDYCYRVQVGLPKPHSVENYTDPPVLLRFSALGSQSQVFDCDSGVNQKDEIRAGCQTYYTENYVDPDGPTGPLPAQWNNFLCNGWGVGNLPPPTFGPGPSPYPSDCVITQTGNVVSQRQGVHERFELPTCVPNNWPDDATEASVFFGPDGGGYGSDKRYVTLIITDDTAFQSPGNHPLPIKYFAGFYVTGWDYHAQQSPGCPDPDGPGPLKGNDDHPIYGPLPYQHSLDDGDVWGYFVDIVVFSSEGEPSEHHCNFGGDPAACVARLVE